MTTRLAENPPDPIPNHVHFVWYGTGFPLLNRVAIESALAVCRPERATLWHADPLEGRPQLELLRRWPAFETRRLDSASLFPDEPAGALDGAALRRVYDGVSSPVSRSNLARAGVLFRHGGVYLDLDTLVLRDLAPLRRRRGFLGTERVVWPGERKERVDAYRLVVGPLLSALRKLASLAPGGERIHLRTAPWYPREVNGAIMGFCAGHPFLAYLLELTAKVPEAQWNIPHHLGTFLLQRAVKHYAGGGLELLDTECFYPLGPVASVHYFRRQRDLAAMQRRVITERTYAVHWYASVTALTGFGAGDLRREAGETLFARLCAPYAADPPAAA
jgi:hypothetical protein